MNYAYWGTMRWGSFRWSVYRDDWDKMLDAFELIASHDLTLRKLSLGARDSTTRWRAKSYTESTIEGIFATKGMAPSTLPVGLYVRYDAVLRTADGVFEGDEIEDAFGNYWEVKAVEDHAIGDSFQYRDCHLVKMPLHT